MRKLLLFIFAFSTLQTFATHLVGGEMVYTYTGTGNTYDVTLVIYRDDYNGNPAATFDDPAVVYIFDENDNYITRVLVNSPQIEQDIDSPDEYNNPCLEEPSNVRIDKGTYQFQVTLPSDVIGYHLVYGRCCRNGALVQNLNNPGAQGQLTTVFIPPTATYQNNSPVFNVGPPIFLCNTATTIQHGATDADGDSLAYSLCSPYQGLDAGNPQMTVNDISPDASLFPPFTPVVWDASFSASNPLGGSFNINSNTGLMNITPSGTGTFTVGVCVSEYRNGVLLSTVLRDFQYTVVDCDVPFSVVPGLNIGGEPVSELVENLNIDVSVLPPNMTAIDIIELNCNDFEVTFENTSTVSGNLSNGADTYSWDFGDGNTSTAFEPTHTYADTGAYIVTNVIEATINGQTCADTGYYLIYIYPILEIEMTVDDVCVNDSIHPFVDVVQGASYDFLVEWNWVFGDGGVSTDSLPAYTYATPGNYDVEVLIRSDKGCARVDVETITVHPAPVASFTFPSPICDGVQAQFTNTSAGTGLTYEWDYDEGTANTQNVNHTFTNTGVHDVTLWVESVQGCRDSITQQITIDTLPNVTASVDDNEICIGDDVIFIGGGAGASGFYVWDNGVNNGMPYTPANIGNTTYTVIGMDGNGCQNTATVNVLVHALPVITANVDEADSEICLNDDVVFTGGGAGAGGTYIWDNGVTDGMSFTPPSIGNVTYFVTGIDANGCVNIDSIDVLVDTLPVVTAMSNDLNDSICEGDDIILTGGNALTYVWDNGVTDGNTFIPTPVGTNTYMVTGTDGNGCVDTEMINIEVLALPIVVANSNDNNNILCLEDSIILFGTGANTYIWDNGVLDNEPFAMLIAGTTTYNVVGTDIHGCINSDSIDILVNVLPLSDAGEDTSVCLNVSDLTVFNSTVPLQATGGVAYLWSPDDGSLNDINIANPDASPSVNTDYIVQVTDDNNCVGYDTVRVFVLNPALELIELPTDSGCIGDTVYPSILEQGIISTYSWTPTNFVTDPIANQPGFFPTVNTQYTLTIQNYCYADEDSVLIEILPLTVIDAGQLDSVCLGESHVLMPNPTSHEYYEWSSTDASLIDFNNATPTVTPDVTSMYYLFAIDSVGTHGCPQVDSVEILVHNIPTIDAVLPATYPEYVCLGAPITLEAITNDGIEFIWSSQPNSPFDDATAQITDAFPVDTSWYYVTTTNIHDCVNSDSVKVNVQHPVTGIFGGDIEHCRFDSAQVFASGGFYYEWLPSNYFSNPDMDTTLVSLDSTGFIQVLVSNDCFTDTVSQEITVHQLPEANAGEDTIIQRDAEIATLFGYGSGGIAEWFALNEDPLYGILTPADESEIEVSPFETTDYVVEITDLETFCLNYDTVRVNVNVITLWAIPTGFSPNGDGVNDFIHVLKYLNIKELDYFAIYDRWGELVYRTEELEVKRGWDGTFKGRDCEIGTYVWIMEGTTKDLNKVKFSNNITLIR